MLGSNHVSILVVWQAIQTTKLHDWAPLEDCVLANKLFLIMSSMFYSQKTYKRIHDSYKAIVDSN
jgi:hypothetical protein